MGDLFSIVEAAYSIEVPSQCWSLGILQAIQGAIEPIVGAVACSFDVKANGTVIIDRASIVSIEAGAPGRRASVDDHENAPLRWLTKHFGQGQKSAACILTNDIESKAGRTSRANLAAQAAHNRLNIAARDKDDRGVVFSFGVPPEYRMNAAVRASLTRVARHVLVAVRLRRRLGELKIAAKPLSKDVARSNVVCGTSDLRHANSKTSLTAARRTLLKAVRSVEDARTSMEGDPERAFGPGKEMVGARWDVVDQIESDGTKYIVARETCPHARGLLALTETERRVITTAARGLTTKEIAYELGMSDTTVRVLLMRAANRCAVRNRRELLGLWESRQRSNTG